MTEFYVISIQIVIIQLFECQFYHLPQYIQNIFSYREIFQTFKMKNILNVCF